MVIRMNEKSLCKLIAKIGEQLNKWDVPSASVSIVENKKVLFSGGIGLRDNASLPADADTLYQIASCTKAFTGTAAAVLATEGKLDFDTPISQYMPEFRLSDDYATHHLTVRDLLSHRTGLPRHELAWYGTGFSRELLMKNLKYLPFNAPIRYKFQYSNFNYLIIGSLIEKITGMQFEHYLMEHLLRPIGMEKTEVFTARMLSNQNHALPFDHDEPFTTTGIKQIPFYFSPGIAADEGDPCGAAGCINSCASDMVKWLEFNLNRGKVGEKELVREDLMDLIITPHIDMGSTGIYAPERSVQAYGLGWMIYTYRGHKMVEHGGNLNGFTSSTAFVPELGLGVFVSVNMNVSLLAEAIVHETIDAVLGQSDGDWNSRLMKYNKEIFEESKELFANFGGSPIPGTTPSHPLTDYAGEYNAPGYRRFIISYENGSLTADFNTFIVSLRHHHYDSFATIDVLGELPAGVILSFGTSPDGKINSLSVLLGGESNLKPIVFTK